MGIRSLEIITKCAHGANANPNSLKIHSTPSSQLPLPQRGKTAIAKGAAISQSTKHQETSSPQPIYRIPYPQSLLPLNS